MKKSFINVGFEFTASLTKGEKLTNPSLYRNGSNVSEHYGSKTKVSKYDWITKRYNSDDCGCEVSTPVIRNKADVSRYFKEFQSFVKSSNLSIDIEKSIGCLGGCHIHLGIGFMPMAFRRKFLRNVGIYLTNHPQLNWGFNEVNDNINANSLLTQQELNKNIPSYFASCNIEMSCYAKTNSIGIRLDSRGNYVREEANNPLTPFKTDKMPYNAFMTDPTKIFLKKKFALRYNEDYKTLELRFFDMPKNLKQHLLHYDVAMAIFNECYKTTLKNEAYYLMYSDWIQYIKEPVDVALLKFDLCMKELGIAKSRTNEMRDNIITRHKWQKTAKKEIYLL